MSFSCFFSLREGAFFLVQYLPSGTLSLREFTLFPLFTFPRSRLYPLLEGNDFNVLSDWLDWPNYFPIPTPELTACGSGFLPCDSPDSQTVPFRFLEH